MFRSRGCSHAELRVHIVANSDQTPANSDQTPTKLRQTPTELLKRRTPVYTFFQSEQPLGFGGRSRLQPLSHPPPLLHQLVILPPHFGHYLTCQNSPATCGEFSRRLHHV